MGLKLLGDNTIHQQIITDEGLQQLKTIRYQQRRDGGITTADRASDEYFKRAWANTFDFLPLHWQNQLQSSSRRAFYRRKPRASHF